MQTPPEPRDGSARYATATITAELRGEIVPVTLFYREDDPFAVRLCYSNNRRDDWVFGRSLLASAAVWQPCGPTHEVVVARKHARLEITLAASRPEDAATIVLRTQAVLDFLQMTYALVPAERESDAVDWHDAERALRLPPGVLTSEVAE